MFMYMKASMVRSPIGLFKNDCTKLPMYDYIIDWQVQERLKNIFKALHLSFLCYQTIVGLTIVGHPTGRFADWLIGTHKPSLHLLEEVVERELPILEPRAGLDAAGWPCVVNDSAVVAL